MNEFSSRENQQSLEPQPDESRLTADAGEQSRTVDARRAARSIADCRLARQLADWRKDNQRGFLLVDFFFVILGTALCGVATWHL